MVYCCDEAACCFVLPVIPVSGLRGYSRVECIRAEQTKKSYTKVKSRDGGNLDFLPPTAETHRIPSRPATATLSPLPHQWFLLCSCTVDCLAGLALRGKALSSARKAASAPRLRLVMWPGDYLKSSPLRRGYYQLFHWWRGQGGKGDRASCCSRRVVHPVYMPFCIVLSSTCVILPV